MSFENKAKSVVRLWGEYPASSGLYVSLEDVKAELISRAKSVEQQMLDSPKHSFTFGDVLRFLIKANPELTETAISSSNTTEAKP